MSTISLHQQNFQSELDTQQPVLIDFWAPWCGPCRMFAPVVEEIAEENAGKIKVGKVNIDEEPELARQFGVMSIPTLVLCKDGKIVSKSVGAQPKHRVQAMLEQARVAGA